MPQRILVIEDDDETRELLRMALEKRGYQVTVAEDGVRGYDTALFLKPDLIVTDIQMPGADGFTLAASIRKDPTLTGAAIMMLTSSGQPGDAARCRELSVSLSLRGLTVARPGSRWLSISVRTRRIATSIE